MKKTKIGIGMVGAGFLAETRARCYRRIHSVDAKIVAVVARSDDSARKYAARHNVGRISTIYDDLLTMPEVDVVDLCVPNSLHRPMAEAAAAAGKNIICTKPMTAYVGQDLGAEAGEMEVSNRSRTDMLAVVADDAESMVNAADRAGVRLMYGENWVYATAVNRANDLLQTSGGTILEMRGWESHNGSHSPYAKLWKHTGGGALLRLGAHPIGALIYLKHVEGVRNTGEPIRPKAVMADVGDLSRIPSLSEENTYITTGWKDVENWGCAIITFSDGSKSVAYGSDNMLGGMESKLQVLASNCHLKCNLSPNNLLLAYAPADEIFGEQYLMEKVDTKACWSTPIPDEDWSSGHQTMCQEFMEALVEGKSVVSDGKLGMAVTRTIYSAYLSASEGRAVEL
jgi:predicted dehydrogenase